MIKKNLAFIVIGLSLFLISCQNDNANEEGFLNREFKLKAGQQIHFKQENLRVKFINVPKDSRCTGVCAWEGVADAAIEIIGDSGKTDSLILNTTNQRGNSTTKDFGQYEIRLIQLNSDGYIFSAYTVTLLLTKK